MNQKHLPLLDKVIFNTNYKWVFHLLFWIVVFSNEIITNLEIGYDEDTKYFLISAIIEILIVSFNSEFLFRKFLLKGKTSFYLLYTSISIIVYITLTNYIFQDLYTVEVIDDITGEITVHELPFFINIATYFLRIISLLGIVLGIKLFKQYSITQKMIYQTEQDSLKNELHYLKNQINPHFLFNSLNTIYINCKMNYPQTPHTILLLSNLLRYQLYECTNKYISLSGEIKYLENFIELESYRQNEIQIDFKTKNIQNQKIAPFIFMPFIENSIKFSNQTENPWVKILIEVTDSNIVVFKISNNKISVDSPSSNKGIGLNNVKRRLHLLYPEKHSLKIENLPSEYHVYLSINI